MAGQVDGPDMHEHEATSWSVGPLDSSTHLSYVHYFRDDILRCFYLTPSILVVTMWPVILQYVHPQLIVQSTYDSSTVLVFQSAVDYGRKVRYRNYLEELYISNT